MTALLEARSLGKSFGATTALDDASLTIEPREFVAMMGPSGSGKSTLLHCLAGIITPQSGTLTYDGRSMRAMGDRERSELRLREFGFVFQFGQLVPELTCLENVALPLQLAGRPRRSAAAAARSWLERVGAGAFADEHQSSLSGGQAQRVAVARALIHQPRVIFADEPTGALDSLGGEQVMQLLTTSAKESGAALVLVTHSARVAAYADRCVTVRDGCVIERVAA